MRARSASVPPISSTATTLLPEQTTACPISSRPISRATDKPYRQSAITRRGNAGPGSATGPNDPRADICTITGNRRNNVLNGTPGNDIICGFGGPGNDVIVGGAGLDSLYGNSGNDRLLAKDGVKDLVDGGPGRGDVARRDRKDRVRGVP